MNRNRSDMGIMGEDTGYSIAHGEAVAAYLFFFGTLSYGPGTSVGGGSE